MNVPDVFQVDLGKRIVHLYLNLLMVPSNQHLILSNYIALVIYMLIENDRMMQVH